MDLILNLFKVILLSFIEGVTDLLPLGREGHFVLFDSILTLYPLTFFEVFKSLIRVGSLIAIILTFKTQLNLHENKIKSIRLWMKLIFESLPILITGLFLNPIIDNWNNCKWIIGITMIALGIILFKKDKKMTHSEVKSFEKVSFKQLFGLGVFQCLSLIPGCSVNVVSIIGLLRYKCSRRVAGEYSLLLGILIIFVDTVFRLIRYVMEFGFFSFIQCVYILLGITVSFILSYVVIRLFLNYIKRNTYLFFSLYQVVLGVFILIYFYVL